MKKIIAALGFATFLSGTAFAQSAVIAGGFGPHPAAMGTHVEHARDLVREINRAYGTSFLDSEVAPPAKAGVLGAGVKPGSHGSQPTLQTTDPETSR